MRTGGEVEMKDRETVIEALQYLISGDCTETQFDYTDDIEAAIAMLKEQEESELCDRCGRRRMKSNRVEGR